MIKQIKIFFSKLFYNPKKTDLYKHAKSELDMLLESCKDDKNSYKMQKELNKNLLKTIETFISYAHNGGIIEHQVKNLVKLLAFYPLFPLTGKNDEWMEVSRCKDDSGSLTKILYQNKRCDFVFREIYINKFGEKVNDESTDVKNIERISKFPYYPSEKYL